MVGKPTTQQTADWYYVRLNFVRLYRESIYTKEVESRKSVRKTLKARIFINIFSWDCSSSSPEELSPVSARLSSEDWLPPEPWDLPCLSPRWSDTLVARLAELPSLLELSQMTWDFWNSLSLRLLLSASPRLHVQELSRPVAHASPLTSLSWRLPLAPTLFFLEAQPCANPRDISVPVPDSTSPTLSPTSVLATPRETLVSSDLFHFRN